MQKEGNLFLKQEVSLGKRKVENKQDNSLLKVKNTENIHYDHKHNVTNFIREEVILSHRPPKDSLSEAVFLNDIDKIISLLEQGVNCNCPDNTGKTYSWTPLYWSVKLRRLECIEILLEAGADINLVVNDSDECCGTALDLSTLRDDTEIEDILRAYAEKEDVNLGQSFKAIRTKLRGKAPAFNFRHYGKNPKDQNDVKVA